MRTDKGISVRAPSDGLVPRPCGGWTRAIPCVACTRDRLWVRLAVAAGIKEKAAPKDGLIVVGLLCR